MKTMISMDKKHIKRVTDEKAIKLYHEGWNYTTKSVWKEQVRDVEKTPKNHNLTHMSDQSFNFSKQIEF